MKKVLSSLWVSLFFGFLAACSAKPGSAPSVAIIAGPTSNLGEGNGKVVDGDGTVQRMIEQAKLDTTHAMTLISQADVATLANTDDLTGYPDEFRAPQKALTHDQAVAAATLAKKAATLFLSNPSYTVKLWDRLLTVKDGAGNSTYVAAATQHLGDAFEIDFAYTYVAGQSTGGILAYYEFLQKYLHEVTHFTGISDYEKVDGFTSTSPGRDAVDAAARFMLAAFITDTAAAPTCSVALLDSLPTLTADADGNPLLPFVNLSYQIKAQAKVTDVSVLGGAPNYNAATLAGVGKFPTVNARLIVQIADAATGLSSTCGLQATDFNFTVNKLRGLYRGLDNVGTFDFSSETPQPAQLIRGFATQVENSRPLYSCRGGTDRYTSTSYVAANCTATPVIYLLNDGKQAGSFPLYRCMKTVNGVGSHLSTPNPAAECTPNGYTVEGIMGFGF